MTTLPKFFRYFTLNPTLEVQYTNPSTCPLLSPTFLKDERRGKDRNRGRRKESVHLYMRIKARTQGMQSGGRVPQCLIILFQVWQGSRKKCELGYNQEGKRLPSQQELVFIDLFTNRMDSGNTLLKLLGLPLTILATLGNLLTSPFSVPIPGKWRLLWYLYHWIVMIIK